MFENLDISRQTLFKYILWAIFIIGILLLNFFFVKDYISSNSSQIKDYILRDEDINPTREAAVAGLFYPADAYQLERAIDGYLSLNPSTFSRRPHIMVVPHAGYLYSAEVAAKAYQQLLPYSTAIKKVIILGPSHKVNIKGAALSRATGFRTPLGRIKTDKNTTDYFSALKGFSFNDYAHKDEHALEVQLPFLQKTLKNFSIIPIIYGQSSPEMLADAISPILEQDDALLIVSADLSHYLNVEEAKLQDSQTRDMVSAGEKLKAHQSCGATGINTAMILAKKFGLKPSLLDFANSGDVSGITDRVVGYASWVFAGEPDLNKNLTPLEQEVENLTFFAKHNRQDIIKIVKQSLVLATKDKNYTPTREEYPDVMFDKGAAFVTLEIDNKLRGCIGSLLPTQAISLDIAQNVYAAANKDKRFTPLKDDELPNIDFTVSLLSSYERINFKSEDDLLNKIKPYEDGLVIRDGDRQGLLLPSVWKDFSTPKEFLNALKIKAGLSPLYWSDKVKIYKFRTVEIKDNEA